MPGARLGRVREGQELALGWAGTWRGREKESGFHRGGHGESLEHFQEGCGVAWGFQGTITL